MGPSLVDIAEDFTRLLDEGKYEDGAELLADDVYFASPKFAFKSKAEWLEKFPDIHKKNPPAFEPFVPGAHEKQIVRKGKFKFMGVRFTLTETIEFNDDGKIQRATTKR